MRYCASLGDDPVVIYEQSTLTLVIPAYWPHIMYSMIIRAMGCYGGNPDSRSAMDRSFARHRPSSPKHTSNQPSPCSVHSLPHTRRPDQPLTSQYFPADPTRHTAPPHGSAERPSRQGLYTPSRPHAPTTEALTDDSSCHWTIRPGTAGSA